MQEHNAEYLHFSSKNLHNSKKSSIFVADFVNLYYGKHERRDY